MHTDIAVREDTGAPRGEEPTTTTVRRWRRERTPDKEVRPAPPTTTTVVTATLATADLPQTPWKEPELLRIGKVTIPKIIHQSWKTKNLTGNWKSWSQSWQQCLPDWQYRFYDDHDNRALIKANFPEVLEAFDGFARPVMRADVSRLAYLASFGGLYADLDIECVKDPTALLKKNAASVIMTCEGCKTLSNAFFVSDNGKGRAFFRHFVMAMVEKTGGVKGHTDVLHTTGPWWFSSAVGKWANVHAGAWRTEKEGPKEVRRMPLPSELGSGEIAVLDHKFILGIHVQDGHWQEWCQKRKKECVTVFNQSYTLHHWTHTWMPKKKQHR